MLYALDITCRYLMWDVLVFRYKMFVFVLEAWAWKSKFLEHLHNTPFICYGMGFFDYGFVFWNLSVYCILRMYVLLGWGGYDGIFKLRISLN